jgi:hypothetical protein
MTISLPSQRQSQRPLPLHATKHPHQELVHLPVSHHLGRTLPAPYPWELHPHLKEPSVRLPPHRWEPFRHHCSNGHEVRRVLLEGNLHPAWEAVHWELEEVHLEVVLAC